MRGKAILGAAALLLLAACNQPKAPVGAVSGDVASKQAWTPEQRTQFYTYSQGSRLLPLSWARALEMAKSTDMFLSPAHIEKLGYLAAPDGKPESLPVGFAVDTPADEGRLSYSAVHWMAGQDAQGARPEPWLGLNCSACHTARITYKTKAMTIDGGPALSDFQGFLADLRASLDDTLTDPDKFKRFADRVLKDEDAKSPNDPQAQAKNRDMLRHALESVAKHEDDLGKINETSVAYGPGRLDAFGHIYSKIAYSAAPQTAIPQPSDAPTSYPYIWGIPFQDKIQYNGIATNFPVPGAHTTDVGAMARNAGEAIGVFADLKLTSSSGGAGAALTGYKSSINFDNLNWFEQELEALRAPPWPGEEMFGDAGKLDPTLVKRGSDLFNKTPDQGGLNCASCHQLIPADQQTTRVKIKMSPFVGADPPGTDPAMACNAYFRQGPSGVLKGTPDGLLGAGTPYPAQAKLGAMLKTSVAGAILDQKGKVIAIAAANFFGLNQPVKPKALLNANPANPYAACLATNDPLLAYKARPLNGIWATAPYLHNGSVPTLAALLNPAKRPPVFWISGREYDPKDVGFVSTPNVGWKFDTSLPGNSNAGHDYGTSKLSDADRAALVEYLKTL
ncbi:MAG: hypothetical protein JSR98_11605 [Proteobacteria bacterium]|nr:hypothetical protein [Pseudomonadota bacterium]